MSLCGGQEVDCDTNGDGICEEICTRTFLGFDPRDGKTPICSLQKCDSMKCVGSDPGK